MARNFTIANPNLPATYPQKRAIGSLCGNPRYYVTDKEDGDVTDYGIACDELTKGEANEILSTGVVPKELMELAAKVATKVPPKATTKKSGKAAAEHVKAKPAATKPKATQPAVKRIAEDDRIFSIQSSIEGIRETQERQAESLKGIDSKLERVSAKLTAIEKTQEATSIVIAGFSAILNDVKQNTTKVARKPKAA